MKFIYSAAQQRAAASQRPAAQTTIIYQLVLLTNLTMSRQYIVKYYTEHTQKEKQLINYRKRKKNTNQTSGERFSF
jgi:hypothetical protein